MMKPLIFRPIAPPSNSIESTYTYLFSLAEREPTTPSGSIIETDYQTQGRGQRGNTWYSSKGLNLIPSILMRYPYLKPGNEFRISVLTTLAIVGTIRKFIPDTTSILVKWPNDIYCDDKKVAGILIGHSVEGGYILFSVIGIGLNVNEYMFPLDIPNPTSLKLINGAEINLSEVREELLKNLSLRLPYAADTYWKPELHDEYCALLYRKDTWHPYKNLRTGEDFVGKIETVSESGLLEIRTEQGELLSFGFKEIAYTI